MKNIRNSFIILLSLVIGYPLIGFSQDSLSFELSYNVYRNYPPLSITKEKLKKANTLIDLNKNYKPSWIREYISVEILTSYKGKPRKAMGENITLNQEQKDIMNMADVGTDISVKVHYIPENTLKHNDPKEINFTFSVEPENQAKFPGGQQQLKQYLKENLIDKISEAPFRKYQLAVVKFIIDEEEHIQEPRVFQT